MKNVNRLEKFYIDNKERREQYNNNINFFIEANKNEQNKRESMMTKNRGRSKRYFRDIIGEFEEGISRRKKN